MRKNAASICKSRWATDSKVASLAFASGLLFAVSSFRTSPRSGRDPESILLKLGSAGCRRAGYFPFGESNQSHCAGTPVSATSCCRNCPAHLAPSGPARTRTSLCSDIRALLPLGAAMLGEVQWRQDALRCPALHGLRLCKIQRSRPWKAVTDAVSASLHDAAARSRKAEQAPHVRGHGWPSSARLPVGEHQGEFQRHDVAETIMWGAVVLATCAVTKIARPASAERNRVRHQPSEITA